MLVPTSQFTLRDLLIDTLILAICATFLREVPDRAANAAAVLFGGLLFVLILGRLCDRRRAAYVGAAVGAILGPALVVPAVLAVHPPDYDLLTLALPFSIIFGAVGTSLFFVFVHWIQHLGSRP